MNLEWRLRYAQAFDALSDLRGHLEVRTHLYKFKDRFVRGQRANTRSQTIIKAVDNKIKADAERYNAAYDALRALVHPLQKSKSGWDNRLRRLLPEDIRHVSEGEDGQSEGKRVVSWIWQASAAPAAANGSATVDDSLQECEYW